MADNELPIFYSFRRCPYAIRARLALAVSGTDVELREVLLRDKPQEFIDASPSATVPALVFSAGGSLDESLDIMFWALAQRDPDGWLGSGKYRAERDDLIAVADGDFKFHLDHYKYSTRYPENERESHRRQASGFLLLLDQKLKKHGCLLGSEISLADMAISPFVRQFANTDRDWFDTQTWTSLKLWLERFTSSKIFQSVMDKYPQWRAGDPKTVFPTTGKLTF